MKDKQDYKLNESLESISILKDQYIVNINGRKILLNKAEDKMSTYNYKYYSCFIDGVLATFVIDARSYKVNYALVPQSKPTPQLYKNILNAVRNKLQFIVEKAVLKIGELEWLNYLNSIGIKNQYVFDTLIGQILLNLLSLIDNSKLVYDSMLIIIFKCYIEDVIVNFDINLKKKTVDVLISTLFYTDSMLFHISQVIRKKLQDVLKNVKLNESALTDILKYYANNKIINNKELSKELNIKQDKVNKIVSKILHNFIYNGKYEKALRNRELLKFDTKELKKGIEIEHEHTNDKLLAKRIAMDHLTLNPKYYSILSKWLKD